VRVMDMKMISAEETSYKSFEYDGLKYECSRVGAPLESLREVALRSDVVGITSPFTQQAGIVTDVAKYICAINSKVKVAVGGYDTVTKDREVFYLRNGFDAVLPRNGETEFPRWIASQFGLQLPPEKPDPNILFGPKKPAKELIFPLPDLEGVDYRAYV